MPRHITDEQGKRIRVWTDEEIRLRYIQGQQDAGKKTNEDDLKAAYDRGVEFGNKMVGGAAKAGFEEGFQEGRKKGQEETSHIFDEKIKKAERKGYEIGCEEGRRIGYQQGVDDEQPKAFNLGLMTGKMQERNAIMKEGPTIYKMRHGLPGHLTQFQAKGLRFFNKAHTPLQKTLFFVAAPFAIGILTKQFMKPQLSSSANKMR